MLWTDGVKAQHDIEPSLEGNGKGKKKKKKRCLHKVEPCGVECWLVLTSFFFCFCFCFFFVFIWAIVPQYVSLRSWRSEQELMWARKDAEKYPGVSVFSVSIRGVTTSILSSESIKMSTRSQSWKSKAGSHSQILSLWLCPFSLRLGKKTETTYSQTFLTEGTSLCAKMNPNPD